MLLLGGAESMPKVIPGRVTWLSPLPKGDERRPIIRAERACSGSNRFAASTSPLSLRPYRSRLCHDASFSCTFAGRRPIPTGAKTPTPSRPGARWKWSAFHAIAELVEFPDHPRCACAFGFGTYRRTPLLVAHPLVQNQPKQSAKPMGNGPDGLLVSQARQQPVKCHFEYASFDLYRRLSRLIQQPPHLTIPLRRARAVRLPCALFVPRTHSHPRGQFLLRIESRCLGTHFGDHLHRRIQPETGHFRHALHSVLMLLH